MNAFHARQIERKTHIKLDGNLKDILFHDYLSLSLMSSVSLFIFVNHLAETKARMAKRYVRAKRLRQVEDTVVDGFSRMPKDRRTDEQTRLK